MRETEKRIRLYTARLPKVREKIYASLMLFAVAASMLAVATFSWITLSVAPEVSGMTTTVAANGNLEIALAGKDAAEPNASQVGDSAKEIKERNITWGNLINLSDAGYGLSNIVLRPASLNANDLLNKPLYAAQYTADGRIIRLNNDFRYTVYDPITQTFVKGTDRGIRAISSVEEAKISYDDPNMNRYLEMLEAAKLDMFVARDTFNGLATAERAGRSTKYMDAVTGIVGCYLNDVFRGNTGTEPLVYDDVLGFYELMVVLDENVMTKVGKVLMTIFEIYQTNTSLLTDASGQSVNYEPTTFTSLDAFRAGAQAEWNRLNGVRVAAGKEAITFAALTGSTGYLQSYNQLEADIASLNALVNPGSGIETTITWRQLEPIANHTIEISSVKIAGKTMTQWIAAVNADKTVALDLLGMLNNSAEQNEIIVTKGLLQSLDAILHDGVKGFTVDSITIKFDNAALKAFVAEELKNHSSLIPIANAALGSKDTIKGHILTNVIQEKVQPVSKLNLDFATVNDVIAVPNSTVNFVAKDTYGLALDFWLRTNSNGSFLVLEGDVETVGEDVLETVEYWADGAEAATKVQNAPIYLADITETITTTYTDTSKEAETIENARTDVEVFQVDGVWYRKSNGQRIVTGAEAPTDVYDDQGQTIGTRTVVRTMTTPKKKQKQVIVGYSGANRVWKDEDLPNSYDKNTSTTQGSGSCYTFYANTPEDMAQSLELVAALKVAFIDATGHVLASASFDTDKCYAEYGRVTVPLYLDTNSQSVQGVPDIDTGDRPTIRYIQQMPKNEAVLITAIVYLDGTKLSNDKVLSSGDIQGTMNIQFGAYTQPTAMDDETLVTEVREIKASARRYDGQSGLEFAGNDTEDRRVIVSLQVTGSTPKTITANFIRKISETQGSAHDTFTFTNQGNGVWEATVEMDRPGEFILRTVKVDGVEYRLPQEQLPMVKVPGFSVANVMSTDGHGTLYTHRTANNYISENFRLDVYSGDPNKLPTTVKGVFMGNNGSTLTIPFRRGSDGSYTSTVTFTTSGTYTMSYVIIDGEYFHLDEAFTRHIYTGLYVKVSLKAPNDFVPEEKKDMTGGGILYFFNGTFHEFDVSVEVFDSSHREMEELGNVALYYGGGLSANLRWNAAAGCYDGQQFLIDRPGSYTFSYVGIAGATITKASSAPTITCATKDPVQYLGITNALEDQIVAIRKQDDGLEISMAFKYGQAATVYGLFTCKQSADAGTGRYYVVKAKSNNDNDGTGETTVTFTLPVEQTDGEGNKTYWDGYWSLIDAKAMTVYDGETGIFYNGSPAEDTEKPDWAKSNSVVNTLYEITDRTAQWDEFDEKLAENGETYEYDYYYNITDLKFVENSATQTKVIASLNFEYTMPSTKSYTGAFMTEHNLGTLNFKVTDFEDKPVDGGTLKLNIGGVSATNQGGFTVNPGSTGNFAAVEMIEADQDISKDLKLRLAGNYGITVSFKLDGWDDYVEMKPSYLRITNPTEYSTSIVVSWTKPEVQIIATNLGNSNTGQKEHTVLAHVTYKRTYDSGYWNKGWKYEHKEEINTKYDGITVTSNWSAYNATLYAEASKCTNFGQRLSEFVVTYPTVTFKLTGKGDASSVAMPFSGDSVYIYEADPNGNWGTTSPSITTWSNEGTAIRYIGQYRGDIISSNHKYVGTGTITANTVVMTYKDSTYDVSYTVTLTNAITINNPGITETRGADVNDCGSNCPNK